MPVPASYETQRAGEQFLFTLENLEGDLTNSVINALTGWDNFYDTLVALATSDHDKTEQIRRHALNLQKHVKPAAVGVSGIAQVETATAAGTVTGTGNGKAVVTGAGISGSPLTVLFAVTNGDTPTVWAAAARAALRATPAITALYYVGGSGTSISLTALNKAANDTTLNIALDNDTSTGITTAASSSNTTPGAAQGSAAADAVVVAWTNRADAIAFAQSLAGHSALPDQYRASSFTQ